MKSNLRVIDLDMTDYFSDPGSPRTEIYQELAQLRLIDPHTHINPHSPASSTLADVLGYHYYTELARSAGMPKAQIEDDSIGPKELVERLVRGLGPIENTVQYSWLISICRMFFGFDEDKLHANNWEALYDRSESVMSSAQWPDMVLDQSNIEAVFLTNDFDDDLAGFDSDRYIPCLRTDDLVFHMADPNVRGRLAACTGIELDGSLSTLRASLRQRFEHFVGRGARACAISIPPSFTPTPVSDGRAATALDAVLRNGLTACANDKEALARRVFWTLAELCDEFGLPFDLMIGVNRKVYPDGVFQGQDLYDSRVSLIQYKELFNSFPDVKFPVSVLASVTNQELVSYAWIFPNVYPNGHWWYSNTPSTIKHDLAARLEAVPQTKMIGYYSDAYKLEFVWPKFDMYRKVLANVLAEEFVGGHGWSIERAVDFGRQVLKDNTEEIFPRPSLPADSSDDAEVMELDDVNMFEEESSGGDQLGAIATVAGGTAAALGMAASGLAEEASELGDDSIKDAIDTAAETAESALEAIQEQDEDSVESIHETVEEIVEEVASEQVVEEEALEVFSEADADDELGDAFDTILMEPTDAKTEDSAGESMDAEIEKLEASTEELAEVELEGFDEDLGEVAAELSEDLPAISFDDDSVATVVELRDTEVPDSDDDSDVSFKTEVVFTEATPEKATEGVETEAATATESLPSVLDGLDPTPEDDEIGELGLDDVELIDPSETRLPDESSLAAELDDEPLDVGDLLSADDSESDGSENAESENDESARTGEGQIHQLTGEASFAPDEESLKLESDPVTGEFTLPAGESEGEEELFDLVPEELGPETLDSTKPAEDIDDLNLSWLNDEDDATEKQ